ncbi:MAG: ATP-dependent Clp protease proteolytic subunit [Clostridia bacterium]|nr:ATP-dependent Clp protease proteolytic subunit [Clostridia bacterium]
MNENPRIVVLNGEVNEASAMDVIMRLLSYEQEDDQKEIRLYINSPGGTINFGMAIYDTIQYIKAPVATICYGRAASMGSFLLSCGAKGRRFALPHSRILIHQPLINLPQGMVASQSEVKKSADSLEKSRNELEKILAENTGKPIEVVHADCERDNWMSAEEAVAYGLIDEVIQN